MAHLKPTARRAAKACDLTAGTRILISCSRGDHHLDSHYEGGGTPQFPHLEAHFATQTDPLAKGVRFHYTLAPRPSEGFVTMKYLMLHMSMNSYILRSASFVAHKRVITLEVHFCADVGVNVGSLVRSPLSPQRMLQGECRAGREVP